MVQDPTPFAHTFKQQRRGNDYLVDRTPPLTSTHRQKRSETAVGKQTPVRSAQPWKAQGALSPGFSSPSPAPHFSPLFYVIIKGLPLPLPLLSICGHCQRAAICESQSSYHITKDPKLAKKGLKIACSSTLYMEGKAKQPKWSARSGYWGMGHPSQGLLCLGGKTHRLGGL